MPLVADETGAFCPWRGVRLYLNQAALLPPCGTRHLRQPRRNPALPINALVATGPRAGSAARPVAFAWETRAGPGGGRPASDCKATSRAAHQRQGSSEMRSCVVGPAGNTKEKQDQKHYERVRLRRDNQPRLPCGSVWFGVHAERLVGSPPAASPLQLPESGASSQGNGEASFSGVPYHSMVDFAKTPLNSTAQGQSGGICEYLCNLA